MRNDRISIRMKELLLLIEKSMLVYGVGRSKRCYNNVIPAGSWILYIRNIARLSVTAFMYDARIVKSLYQYLTKLTRERK